MYRAPEGLIFIIAIVVLVAWCMAISLLVEAAKEKGYYRDGGAGRLWFIGLFATPLVIGLYVCALPDKSNHVDKSDIPTL